MVTQQETMDKQESWAYVKIVLRRTITKCTESPSNSIENRVSSRMEELMKHGEEVLVSTPKLEDPNRAQTLVEERKKLESLSNWFVWE